MFKKIVTSIDIYGRTSKEARGTVAAEDVPEDMVAEHARISAIARSDNGIRILTVEETDNAVVVVYKHGAVKIYHWIPEGAE